AVAGWRRHRPRRPRHQSYDLAHQALAQLLLPRICAPPCGNVAAPVSGEHADIVAALAKLRAEQREALILVEAIRFSFGEVARIWREPAGRLRSLVEGARADLARHLERQRGERPNRNGVSLGLLLTAEHHARPKSRVRGRFVAASIRRVRALKPPAPV